MRNKYVLKGEFLWVVVEFLPLFLKRTNIYIALSIKNRLTDNKSGATISKNQTGRIDMNQRLHSTTHMSMHHRRICL